MTLRFFFVFILTLAMSVGGLRNSQAQIAGTATLMWTAPGDDGLIGQATLYDLRYSLEPINDENFPLATRVAMVRPSTPGATETYVVTGLLPNFDYYFAVRTTDDAGNWSKVSNLAYRPARNIILESAREPFGLSLPWPNPVRSRAHFTLTMPTAGEAWVDVFDSQGRRVNNLAAGNRPPGRVEVWWNLDDYWGRPVQAGLYLVRARLGAREVVRRVAVVK